MAQDLNLFVDVDNGRCVLGFTSVVPATLAPFKFGDSVPVIVRALTANSNNSAQPYKEYDVTGKAIRLAIGTPAGKPAAGDWILTFGSDSTDPIPFSATASQIQTALNNLETIGGAGGVTVTSPNAGIYRVVWNDTGARAMITADTSALYPTSGAFISRAIAGGASTREVQSIKLEVQPAAYVQLDDELPPAAISINVARTGSIGVGAIQTIDLSNPEPYGGSYALTVSGHGTAAITYNALASEVQSAIESADVSLTGKVAVTGEFPLYSVSFDSTLGEVTQMAANVAALVVPTGRKGQLNLNTDGIVGLLNGGVSASAKLEIEIYDVATSTPWTPIWQDVTVVEDVIPNSPASQTPLPVFVSAEDLAEMGESKADKSADNIQEFSLAWREKLGIEDGYTGFLKKFRGEVPVRAWRNNFLDYGSGQPTAAVSCDGGRVYASGTIKNSTGEIQPIQTIFDIPNCFQPPVVSRCAIPANPAPGHNGYITVGVEFANGSPPVCRTFTNYANDNHYDFLEISASFRASSNFEGYAVNQIGDDQVSLVIPKVPPGQYMKLCVYVHGAGNDHLSHLTDVVGSASTQDLMRATVGKLLDNGFAILSFNGGEHTDNWGNNASFEAMQSAINWVKGYIKFSQVVLLGQSMGGLLALQALSEIDEIVKCYLIYPVCDLHWAYDSGQWTSAIDTAFEGDFTDNSVGCDPMLIDSEAFNGKSLRMCASYDDTVVSREENTDAFADKVEGHALVSVRDHVGNHGDQSAFDDEDIVEYFLEAD